MVLPVRFVRQQKGYAPVMHIAERARRVLDRPSATGWYEQVGVIPAPERAGNGYRPEDAGQLARMCLEQGAVDLDLAPRLAQQRAAIARQRADLERLEGELIDLEMMIAAAGRAPGGGVALAAGDRRVGGQGSSAPACTGPPHTLDPPP